MRNSSTEVDHLVPARRLQTNESEAAVTRTTRLSHHPQRWFDVPVYASPRYERVATKQASKKEIRDAQRLLDCDPLHGNKPQARERRRQESPGVAMRR
jgi:hypothetical protein